MISGATLPRGRPQQLRRAVPVLRYCGEPDGVHVDEIIRIEDPWSFGRSPIAPLLLVPLCAVVPWPAAP